MDNGDITGGESWKETFIHLYHVSASVLLEFSGVPERVSLWADGDGLRSGQAIFMELRKTVWVHCKNLHPK